MDALGEVIIGNKIYSARYAQPPRTISEGEEEKSDHDGAHLAKPVSRSWNGGGVSTATTDVFDASGGCPSQDTLGHSWPLQRRNVASLITTDLDELPVVEEPDYINLRVRDSLNQTEEDAAVAHIPAKGSSGRKIFSNTYVGREENIYEEINELQRRLALEQEVRDQHCVSMTTRPLQQQQQQQQQRCWPAFYQPTSSLVDEVMDEVARVRLGHDTVLNQLNLDLEHFLKPQTPEPSPSPPLLSHSEQDSQQGKVAPSFNVADQRSDPVKNRSRSTEDSTSTDKVPTVPGFSTPPPSRIHRKFISHNRSNSSVTFTMSQLIGAGERSLVRCESLDFGSRDFCVRRRPSVVSRASTSTSSSVSSNNRSDTRQSIRNLHQGLQQGIQGLADWTEKCGLLLAKRSKKVIAFVSKGRNTLMLFFNFSWYCYTIYWRLVSLVYPPL